MTKSTCITSCRLARYGLIITFAATVAGCVTGGSEFTRALNPFANSAADVEAMEQPFIESERARERYDRAIERMAEENIHTASVPDAYRSLSAQLQTAKEAQEATKLFPVHMPQFQSYAETVLDDILAGWPGDAPPISVHLRSGSKLEAQATRDNVIHLTLGTLDNLDNENQLAFVLAHEASHLLLSHFDRERFIETNKNLIESTQNISLLAASIGSDSASANSSLRSETATAAILGRAVLDQAVDTALGPAWVREQEAEADVLGIDLMAKAGYPPQAALAVLDKLAKMAEEREAEAEAVSRQVNALMEASLQSGNVGGVVNTMIGGSLALAGAGLSDLKNELEKSHAQAEERKRVVQAYSIKFYLNPVSSDLEARRANRWRAAISAPETTRMLDAHNTAFRATLRAIGGDVAVARQLSSKAISLSNSKAIYPLYAAAHVAESSGRYNEALAHLGKATALPGANAALFLERYRIEVRQGLLLEALMSVDRAEQLLTQPENISAYRLLAEKNSGRKMQAEATYRRCLKVENITIRQECRSIMGRNDGFEGQMERLVNQLLPI